MVVFPALGPLVEQAHAEEAFRGGAEGLPVEEVAPAAHALADEEAQTHHIQQGGNAQLAHPAVYNNTDGRTQHTAVNGQTTLPDIQDGDGIGGIPAGLPGEDAVVKPGAQNGKGNDPQHTVNDVILSEAEFLAPAQTVENRQQQTAGDDQPVKMDAQRSQLQGSGGIQLQIQEGEGNGCVIGRIHVSTSF